MDINDLRTIVTIVSMLTFVGIVVWAYARRNRAAFDEAAQLPFTGDGTSAEATDGDPR